MYVGAVCLRQVVVTVAVEISRDQGTTEDRAGEHSAIGGGKDAVPIIEEREKAATLRECGERDIRDVIAIQVQRNDLLAAGNGSQERLFQGTVVQRDEQLEP